MTIQARWSLSRDDGIVCEAEDIRRLVTALTASVGSVSWEIECADGVSRSGSNIEELLAFDNPPDREIQRLIVRARSDDGRAIASVELGGKVASVSASIDGPSELVQQFRTALEPQLFGLRAWYTRVARLDFISVVLFFFFVMWLTVTIGMALGILATNDEPGLPLRGQAVAYTMIAGAIGAGWLLNRLRERIFPVATFEMGQGKRRHELLEKVRWGVVVAFIVSLVSGLLLVFL